ncbi:MAG: flagellar hook-associated protein FlgK [Calditrichota bacterium]
MSRLSDILSTGQTALRIQQLAMQVVGQNTANIDTEGYSRRRLELGTAPPFDTIGDWHAGAGVDINYLGRVRDRLIDEQIRRGSGSYGYWSARDENLEQIEAIFSELGGSAVSDNLQEFWSAWQDLANDPEGMSARMNLVEKTQTLTSAVRRVAAGLMDRRNQTDQQIVATVHEINDLTASIAGLNTQIVRSELSGAEASDLRDARDLAIDKLSKLMDIQISENPNGDINVYNGGQALVQLDHNVELYVTSQGDSSGVRSIISYGISGRSLQASGGELKALIDLRDQDIGKVMSDLDTFAVNLANRINEVHRTGYGLTNTNGHDFFAGDVTGASNFRISTMITDDPSRIATAAAADSPGDNSLALQIAGIQNEKLMQDGRSTLDDFYRDSVLQVGTAKSYAASQLKTEQAVMNNLENRRQQVSGVSLDEEMARLIQVQQAYEAAAKMINTVDEMMQTVLSLGGAS